MSETEKQADGDHCAEAARIRKVALRLIEHAGVVKEEFEDISEKCVAYSTGFITGVRSLCRDIGIDL